MRDRIITTEPDHDKLRRLLAGRRGSGADHLRELEEELENAEVLDDNQTIPADVITMNSEVRLLGMDSGEMKVYKLVFPSQAGAENALSVLAPISTAILGYRVGDVIEWRVPKGVRRLRGSSLPAGSGRSSLGRGARCVIPARLGWHLEIPTLARAAGV